MDKQRFEEDYYDVTSFDYNADVTSNEYKTANEHTATDNGTLNKGMSNNSGAYAQAVQGNEYKEYYEEPYDQQYEQQYEQQYNPYGGFNPYNNYNQQYNPYGEYDQYRDVLDKPLDSKGRAIPNNFGLKMIFSIIELITAAPFGIGGLIASAMQNDAYNKKDWESFKSRRVIANTLLGIGGAITSLEVAVFAFIVAIAMAEVSAESGHSISEITGITADDDGDELYNPDKGFVSVEDFEGLYTVTINGSELQLPGTFAEYQESWGFGLDEDPSIYVINAREDKIMSIYDKNDASGDFIGSIKVYNNSDEATSINNCMVEGIHLYVRDYNGKKCSTFSYLGEINENSSKDDLIEVLGEPKYDGDYYVEWYTDEGWLNVYYEDNEMKGFDLQVYKTLEKYNY